MELIVQGWDREASKQMIIDNYTEEWLCADSLERGPSQWERSDKTPQKK